MNNSDLIIAPVTCRRCGMILGTVKVDLNQKEQNVTFNLRDAAVNHVCPAEEYSVGMKRLLDAVRSFDEPTD